MDKFGNFLVIIFKNQADSDLTIVVTMYIYTKF